MEPNGQEDEAMTKTLSQLFDYQKFAGNTALQEVIDSVHARYSVRKLDPDFLEQVSAAGAPETLRPGKPSGFPEL